MPYICKVLNSHEAKRVLSQAIYQSVVEWMIIRGLGKPANSATDFFEK